MKGRIGQGKQLACPLCRVETDAFPSLFFERNVMSALIVCTDLTRLIFKIECEKCGWKGSLKDFPRHLQAADGCPEEDLVGIHVIARR